MTAYDYKHKHNVKVISKTESNFVVETRLGEIYTVRPEFLIIHKCKGGCKNCNCK